MTRQKEHVIKQLKLASKLMQAMHPEQAERILSKLHKKHPTELNTLHQLSVIAFQNGRYSDAESWLQKAIAIHQDHNLFYNLGLALHHQGKPIDAIGAYENSLKFAPNHLPSIYSLGATHLSIGNTDEAIKRFQFALKINPAFTDALREMGCAFMRKLEYKIAIECYNKVVSINSGDARAYYLLAQVMCSIGNIRASESAYQKAVEINPNYPQALKGLGHTYHQQNFITKATKCYKKEIAITNNDGARIRLATMIPALTESTTHIDKIRSRLHKNINELLSGTLHVENPLFDIDSTNFYLAYHAKNNKELQCKIANLCIKACPPLKYTANHCKSPTKRTRNQKIHVGFISCNFRDHSIGKTTRGTITHLSRDRFSVTTFSPSPLKDEIGRAIYAASDKSIILHSDITVACKQIADEALDILFYQDIGMDPLTYLLAFCRLAPIQCTYFGHPDTTGIPNIDYFISTEYFESENGEDHYSETLYKLKNVGSPAYCYKPNLPSVQFTRNHFDLEDHANIYICPQALFKFHPEFDSILAAILRNDTNGVLVLKEGAHPNLAHELRKRITSSFPDVIDRIRFFPHLNYNEYMSLLAVSDVMLDTIHFCGFTTSLEGLFMGIPIVTLPDEFMRSRHTFGLYKKMGVPDCIAKTSDEYIAIATRLGVDSEFRKQVRNKINKNKDCVWEDTNVIREIERFFSYAVGRLN